MDKGKIINQNSLKKDKPKENEKIEKDKNENEGINNIILQN